MPHALQVGNGQDVIDKIAWLQTIAATTEHGDLTATCLRHLEPFRCSIQAARAIAMLKDLS